MESSQDGWEEPEAGYGLTRALSWEALLFFFGPPCVTGNLDPPTASLLKIGSNERFQLSEVDFSRLFEASKALDAD